MNIELLIAEATEVEFKVSVEKKKAKSFLKTVCAFANGIGGTLFFGIDDSRNIVGLSDVKKDADFISEIIKQKISPIPKFVLKPIKEKDKDLLLLIVNSGVSTPYFYKSDGVRETFIRVGNETILAPDYAIKELTLKGSNTYFDGLITSYQKQDFSFSILEATYLQRTRLKFELSDYLSFGLVDEEGYLTNAGLLFADNSPLFNSRIFCTRWNGLYKGSVFDDALDDREFKGNLISLLNNALDFVYNNSKIRFEKGPLYRIDKPDYAPRAVMEAIVNALIHRDYLIMGSEIHIDMYDDRLEIFSPGGMYRGAPIQKRVLEDVGSIRRNPYIADLFHRMKFMERRGSGIKKILDDTALLPGYSKEYKPSFRSDESSFIVTLKNMNYKVWSFTDQVSDQASDQASEVFIKNKILLFCRVPRSKKEICAYLGFHNLTYFTRTYLKPLIEENKLSLTRPNIKNSPNQKYISH